MKNNNNQKQYIVVVMLISTLSTFHVHADNNYVDAKKYPEFAKFAKRYACPQDLADKVKTIEKSGFYKSDTFFLKGANIDRLINAIRAKRIIEKHNLDHIAVADKCLCQNKYEDFVVAATRIKSVAGRFLSLKDIQDLITFVEETGFRDWLALDLINDHKNDKLTFIDTEYGSFAIGMVHGNEKEKIPQHCKLVYLVNLGQALGKFMEKDAADFYNQRYEQLLNSPEGTQPHTPIFKNTKYDDADIDFEKVKTEFSQFLSTRK